MVDKNKLYRAAHTTLSWEQRGRMSFKNSRCTVLKPSRHFRWIHVIPLLHLTLSVTPAPLCPFSLCRHCIDYSVQKWRVVYGAPDDQCIGNRNTQMSCMLPMPRFTGAPWTASINCSLQLTISFSSLQTVMACIVPCNSWDYELWSISKMGWFFGSLRDGSLKEDFSCYVGFGAPSLNQMSLGTPDIIP